MQCRAKISTSNARHTRFSHPQQTLPSIRTPVLKSPIRQHCQAQLLKTKKKHNIQYKTHFFTNQTVTYLLKLCQSLLPETLLCKYRRAEISMLPVADHCHCPMSVYYYRNPSQLQQYCWYYFVHLHSPKLPEVILDLQRTDMTIKLVYVVML